MALARALAIEPKVLLLDEPFGALDAKVRQELRQWLRRLHDEIHLTSVFVTHDQDEALELADRVLVMNEGRIEQIGTPDEVFHHPRTEFVVKFLGQVNVFHGRLEGGKVHFATLAWESPEHAGTPTQPARVFIRPHELDVDVHRNGHPALAGRGQPHPLGRSERAAGAGGRVGRAALRGADAGSLPLAEHSPPAARSTSRPATSRCLPTSRLSAARTGIGRGCRAGTFRRRRGLRTARIGLWRRRSLRTTCVRLWRAGRGRGRLFFGLLRYAGCGSPPCAAKRAAA